MPTLNQRPVHALQKIRDKYMEISFHLADLTEELTKHMQMDCESYDRSAVAEHASSIVITSQSNLLLRQPSVMGLGSSKNDPARLHLHDQRSSAFSSFAPSDEGGIEDGAEESEEDFTDVRSNMGWVLRPELIGSQGQTTEPTSSPQTHLAAALISASRSVSRDLDVEDVQCSAPRPVFSQMPLFSRAWYCIAASPTSSRRLAWEVFGCVLICYDLIVVPLVQAFDPPTTIFLSSMDWLTRLFWTFNVPILLTTGFVVHDTLIMHPLSIFVSYCKTWLVLDAITILSDWLIIASNISNDGGQNDPGSFIKVLRILRLLRLARLMRLPKVRGALSLLYTMTSEKISIMLGVLSSVCTLMLANHFIACLWFAVANAQEGNSWLKAHGYSRDRVAWGHQYLLAYHWSLTQFQSSMHVQPQCATERVFAICVLIIGVVGFSYLVGSIASSLAQLRALDQEQTTNFWVLHKFLKEKRVPQDLSVRVRSYVQTRLDYLHKHMEPSKVENLSLLSDNLKAELASSIHGPLIRIHTLFERLYKATPSTSKRVALSAVSQVSLAPRDTLFSAGEDATHMSMLIEGRMMYECICSTKFFSELVIPKKIWVAEPVVWVCAWRHVGDLISTSSTELLLIDPRRLLTTLKSNPIAVAMASEYVKKYVTWMRGETGEASLTDLGCGEMEETWPQRTSASKIPSSVSRFLGGLKAPR